MQTYDKDAMMEGLAKAWRLSGGRIPIVLAANAVALSTPLDTAENIILTIPLEVGLLGLNGQLDTELFWTCTSNANVKTARLRLGGPAGTDCLNASLTSTTAAISKAMIAAQNSLTSQRIFAEQSTTVSRIVTNQTGGAVDLSGASSLVVSMQKATGSDVVTLNAYRFILYPSA